VPGGWLSDISHAIEQEAGAAGSYGIVREYTGHGIGTQMHMDPPVPNYGPAGRGPLLTAGLTLAIEPMLVLKRRDGEMRGIAQQDWPETSVLDDDWTVVTADGSWAAHFEHTVAITEDGPWVLTAEDGGVGGFARFGLAPNLMAGVPSALVEQQVASYGI
jgi:methionyl aminopeptidase